MPNVKWEISNTLGVPAGTFSVDQDATLKVPTSTDESGEKRAGDMVVGDYYLTGNKQTAYTITADLTE